MRVVTFAPKPDPEKAPNTDAIDIVERLLARLKSGAVVDVAIVEVASDGTVSDEWSGKRSYHLLNSGAARLAHRLAAED